MNLEVESNVSGRKHCICSAGSSELSFAVGVLGQGVLQQEHGWHNSIQMSFFLLGRHNAIQPLKHSVSEWQH